MGKTGQILAVLELLKGEIMEITHIAIIALAAIVGLGSVYFLKMKPDNAIEEISEEVIKKETGVDIDLSPTSPEKKE